MNIVLIVLAALLAIVLLSLLINARNVTTIYPPSVGLLYRDGKFRRELGPGRYAYFDPFKRTRVVKVSKAALPVPLPEVTVLSRDQFAFRVGLSPVVAVEDARAFTESQPAVEANPFGQFVPQVASHAALHTLTASAALEAVGDHGLRELLAEPKLLTAAVQAKLEGAIPGARIAEVLLTSVTLPPETRKMFTEVERAKMDAEASLERARGEQAAMRALANAARLVKDNPALASLRFLQTLEQAPGPKTIVLGADAVGPLTRSNQADS